jgi:saccharopine dehydrogenase-like NADP-dependent oxidoreductase
MKACVSESAHYCDLLTLPDGPGTPKEETFAAQQELDRAFKEADAIAIPYVGISGAWISLVAKSAIDRLDSVDEVLICFCAHIDTDEFIAPVAPIVQVSMFFGPPGPLAYQDGELVPVELVGSEEQFDFPGPAGRRSVYTINALGDIALIPQFAGKPIGRLEAKVALGLGRMDTQDIWATALAKAALRQGGAKESINIVDALADTFLGPKDYSRLLRDGRILDDHFTMVVEVRGKKEGRNCRHRNWSITTLEETRKHLPWSWPAVYSNVGGTPVEYVLAMARGEITERGVLRVTDLSNGQQILDAVARRGHILGEETLWTEQES